MPSHKKRVCCYCGGRVAIQREFGRVFYRAYCPECLERVRRLGVVDTPSFPTENESERAVAPMSLESFYLAIG